MTSGRARVDVGVVTWNSAEMTATALRHLLDTDQGCDLRIIVQDNDSHDGTVQALRERVPEADIEVSDYNLGFGKAMNRCIARSDAPYFLAFNSDAWPEPGAIGHLVATAERHPNVAAVAPKLLRPDDTLEHSTHPFPSVAIAIMELVGGRRWLPRRTREDLALEGAWLHDRSRDVDWAVGAALLMPRPVFDQVGGFDERFFMYVEDLEWCWRARHMGFSIRFDADSVVRHIGGASGAVRWGSSRLGLEASYLRIFQNEALGTGRARCYRMIQAAVGVKQYVAGKAHHDREAAFIGAQIARFNLGLLPVPVVDHAADPPEPTSEVEVSVVVPSHNRSERLRRLLTSLERQSYDHSRFEVIVVDDGSSDATPEVLAKAVANSPLDLRPQRTVQRSGPGAARNLGWQSARGRVIAFTDDDCVPQPDWLAAGIAAMNGGKHAVVGRTAPPPAELSLIGKPFARAMSVESAHFFETCNVFYRKVDLAAVGGFDERFRRPSGEDTRLALAVKRRGVTGTFVPEALVYHDVRPGSFVDSWKEIFRWVDLPLVLKDHPEVRPELCHRYLFWKPAHPTALLALGSIIGSIFFRPALVGVLPWLYERLKRDPVAAQPLQRVIYLPAAMAIDLTEIGVMAVGSVRHKTLLL